MASVRIDKWLWSVRIFKTRSMAAEACKKNRVHIDNTPVKPSRDVKEGDIITVVRPPVNYQFIVKGIISKRVSAKLAVDYVDNITPEDELMKLKVNPIYFENRDRGTGRPTKRDRRDIERLKEDFFDEGE